MALIAMIYFRADVQFIQQADATNTKQQFLLQPVLIVTTVELMGDGSVFLLVVMDVSIKKVQRDPAYIKPPRFCIQ